MHWNHPKTIPLLQVHRKIVCHETDPLCQKGWGPLQWARILSYIKLILTQCTFISANSSTVQFSSVAQSCSTLCDPMNRGVPGLPVYHQPLESTQIHVHQVSDAILPSHPLSSLILLPSVFPMIRVFSNESALLIRWPKYRSFIVNIRPSNEDPGMISFRMDWLDLLAVQGTLKSLL